MACLRSFQWVATAPILVAVEIPGEVDQPAVQKVDLLDAQRLDHEVSSPKAISTV